MKSGNKNMPTKNMSYNMADSKKNVDGCPVMPMDF